MRVSLSLGPGRRKGKYENWTASHRGWWHTRPVRSYGQYCPVAKAAEVLGERWTMLIVRDLLTGAHRFTDLHRGLPGISRTLLTQRLRRLERDGLVERRTGSSGRDEYHLTRLGRDLEPAVLALGGWADQHYTREPTRDELDPDLLMLWIERSARRDGFPEGRIVVRFDLERPHTPHPSRYWLIVEGGVPSLCDDDPGFDVDLAVSADLRSLYLVFAGRSALSAALRAGAVRLDGAAEQRRAFTRWFGISAVVAAQRAARAG